MVMRPTHNNSVGFTALYGLVAERNAQPAKPVNDVLEEPCARSGVRPVLLIPAVIAHLLVRGAIDCSEARGGAGSRTSHRLHHPIATQTCNIEPTHRLHWILHRLQASPRPGQREAGRLLFPMFPICITCSVPNPTVNDRLSPNRRRHLMHFDPVT
ncbi:uncharacterized protein CC84DRAFT_585940 [Paraphaeosphaeria sporulosa]|uniref:Uncharacterized protein n=1 Tax=Paraphaeosphaeria sporulosa TaxID=1460663 RepID=A0A177CPC2_9PLEO|nr:uncharacterized protein CC84DRAFT_585940 [Paraphaeosphaeria sporulosa]OAG08730.1 hypothetical protein CC84DRAFT_585940 [Paraphaeosphaeria sporulosa]